MTPGVAPASAASAFPSRPSGPGREAAIVLQQSVGNAAAARLLGVNRRLSVPGRPFPRASVATPLTPKPPGNWVGGAPTDEAGGPAARSVLQRDVVKPEMEMEDGKASEVTLDLNDGDISAEGASPKVEPAAWNVLKTLGLTTGNDDWHRWVRFHVLNENQGGPDDIANLIPTTQIANHHSDWQNLEYELDEADNDPMDRPLHFEATVAYHADESKTWTRSHFGHTAETESSDYPSGVEAKVEVDGDEKASATMDASKGLIRPEDLAKVPYWTHD